MSSHRIQKNWKAKFKAAVPFGLGQAKPKHFRDMAGIAWRNRDNLGYAWKVLSRGVCDGCALGVAGLLGDVVLLEHRRTSPCLSPADT